MIIHQIDNSFGKYNYNAYTYRDQDWYPHFHRSLEVICMLRGAAVLTVDSSAERMEEGDWALVLPNRVHAIASEPGAVYWICVFSEYFVPEFAGRIRGRASASARFVCDGVTDAFLHEKLISGDVQGGLQLQALLLLICDAFLQSTQLTDAKEKDDAAFRVFDIVCERYAEDLHFDDIAREIGYDYHYLSRCLSRTFHMNFRSILNQCRCDRAAQLLREGASVTAAAFDSGFQSVRTFNDVFRKYAGVSPVQFQKGQ